MEYKAVAISTTGELKHWKYIKREKINGKWRYYYDINQLKQDAKKVEGVVGVSATKNMIDARNRYIESGVRGENGITDYKQTEQLHSYYKKQVKDLPNSSYYKRGLAEMNSTKRDYLKSKKIYQKTIIGTPSRIIDAGRKFIEYLKS